MQTAKSKTRTAKCKLRKKKMAEVGATACLETQSNQQAGSASNWFQSGSGCACCCTPVLCALHIKPSFYPSTSSTTTVRADSSVSERSTGLWSQNHLTETHFLWSTQSIQCNAMSSYWIRQARHTYTRARTSIDWFSTKLIALERVQHLIRFYVATSTQTQPDPNSHSSSTYKLCCTSLRNKRWCLRLCREELSSGSGL